MNLTITVSGETPAGVLRELPCLGSVVKAISVTGVTEPSFFGRLFGRRPTWQVEIVFNSPIETKV